MIPHDFSLKTDRLTLRPAISADAPALQAVTNDPAILDMVNFLPDSFPLSAATELINSQDERNHFLAICDRPSGALIGLLGLHWHEEDRIEIGYWLGKDWHGKGLATECLSGVTTYMSSAFPNQDLIAECRPANAPSMKLLLKSGFVETGLEGKRPGRKVLAFRN